MVRISSKGPTPEERKGLARHEQKVIEAETLLAAERLALAKARSAFSWARRNQRKALKALEDYRERIDAANR